MSRDPVVRALWVLAALGGAGVVLEVILGGLGPLVLAAPLFGLGLGAVGALVAHDETEEVAADAAWAARAEPCSVAEAHDRPATDLVPRVRIDAEAVWVAWRPGEAAPSQPPRPLTGAFVRAPCGPDAAWRASGTLADRLAALKPRDRPHTVTERSVAVGHRCASCSASTRAAP